MLEFLPNGYFTKSSSSVYSYRPLFKKWTCLYFQSFVRVYVGV